MTSTISVKIGSVEAISKGKNTATATWQRHSAIFTPSSTGSQNVSIVCNGYPGSNATVNVDGLMIVDVTECFGDTNPDKSWYDSNVSFTTNTTAGTTSVARKIKNIYIGVNGKAQKVTNGYYGVSGKARQFFGAATITFTMQFSFDRPSY